VSDSTEAVRRELSASLVNGIAHDLNGRLGALMGVAHLARASAAMETDLLDLLQEQIHKLRESIGQLRALPLGDRRTEQRLVPLSEAVGAALTLFRCRSGPDPVSFQADSWGESALVHMVQSAFTEALLLTLTAAERGPNGRMCAVRITQGRENGCAHVRVERMERQGRAAAAACIAPDDLTEEALIDSAAECARAAGATLTPRAAGAYEIRFAAAR
jgi:hypothetical protein